MNNPNNKSNLAYCELYGIYCHENWCPFCEETKNNKPNTTYCELHGIYYYKYRCPCCDKTIYLKKPGEKEKPKKRGTKK